MSEQQEGKLCKRKNSNNKDEREIYIDLTKIEKYRQYMSSSDERIKISIPSEMVEVEKRQMKGIVKW